MKFAMLTMTAGTNACGKAGNRVNKCRSLVGWTSADDEDGAARVFFACFFGAIAIPHARALELAPRQRNILRHYYLDGMSIDQIGALYREANQAQSLMLVDGTKSFGASG